MADPSPKNVPDWTDRWTKAAAATAGLPPFQDVYTGPAWEVPSRDSSVASRVWKIAVLERRPGAGADHWGHLFVLLGRDASRTSLRSERGPLGDSDRPDLEFLPTANGSPFRLAIRPRSAGTAERLRAFAIEFERRAEALVRG